MELQMIVEGATPDQLLRGMRAAHAVFDRTQVTPWQAAKAAFDREGYDVTGFPAERRPSDEAFRAAEAWDAACEAALAACCDGWPSRPPGAHLWLKIDDDADTALVHGALAR